MKKIGKIVKNTVLGLGLLGAMAMATGCVNKSSQSSGSGKTVAGKTYHGVDVSKHQDLTMYLIGDRTKDFDEVYAKINEILEEKLNCSLKVEFLSWGEHATKYSLLFSSQEDFDLIFTASSWCHYEQTVSLGGFAELKEDFIKKYAPEIWQTVPAVAWEQAKIDGKIYMVPNYSMEFKNDVIAVRGDLMKKYGFTDITTYDQLLAFYEACAKDGQYASLGGPWYQYFLSKGLADTAGCPHNGELFLNHTIDKNPELIYTSDWQGFSEYCHQMKRLADLGAWSSDILNSNEERQAGLLSGRTAAMIWNLGTCARYAKEANASHPEWQVTICDPNSAMPKSVNSYINNGVAININSKKKERAMMVLNEFYTNKTVNNLAAYGIEGKHWEAVGDDCYRIIDESGYGIDANCNWGWNNQDLKRKEYLENPTALDKKVEELQEAWKKNVMEPTIYDGFNFDSTPVSTQFAAVEAALGNYYDPLVNGLVKDVDKTIAEMKAALESAGIKDIQKELERQAKEFRK